MAFQSPLPNLVRFGACGMPWRAICSASWMLSYAIRAVSGGCRWCVTITIVTGVGSLVLVMVDYVHRFEAVGDLFSSLLDSKVVHCDVSELTRRCFEGFGHKLVKELSFMAIGMDNTSAQLVLLVFIIIEHLTEVHQCFDACNKILGVLSRPGHNILEFSQSYMGVDIMCHSLLYLVKESGSFSLGCSLFLFISSRHPLCMHLQGFCSQGCKDVLEVILTLSCNAVEKEPILQGASKNGEGVICIFQVPVIGG